VLCEYSKIVYNSNSYFTIRFDSKRIQLFEIFKYLSLHGTPQRRFWQL